MENRPGEKQIVESPWKAVIAVAGENVLNK
jgi:hypothetical protein